MCRRKNVFTFVTFFTIFYLRPKILIGLSGDMWSWHCDREWFVSQKCLASSHTVNQNILRFTISVVMSCVAFVTSATNSTKKLKPSRIPFLYLVSCSFHCFIMPMVAVGENVTSASRCEDTNFWSKKIFGRKGFCIENSTSKNIYDENFVKPNFMAKFFRHKQFSTSKTFDLKIGVTGNLLVT